jgi:hypothetical protein
MGWLQQNIVRIVLIGFFATVLGIAGCSSGSSSSGSNDLLPDTDGDGIVNDNDGDIDGDGIPNGEDTDIDGDGKPNDSDDDDDGDGIRDEEDDTSEGADPAKACTTTKIKWPNDDTPAGKVATVTWKLLPKGCALTKAQNQSVKPTATHMGYTTVGVSKKIGSLTTKINVPSAPGQGNTPRAVKYDFSEMGAALGDKVGGYTNTVTHAPPTGEEPIPEPEPDTGGGTPTPDVVCTSAKIIAPDDEALTGSTVMVGWELLPEGCVVTKGSKTGVVYATSKGGTFEVQKWSAAASPKTLRASIEIPHDCSWFDNSYSTMKIKYDIAEIGTALGDPNVAESFAYKQILTHPVAHDSASYCDLNQEPPVVSPLQIASDIDGTCKQAAGSTNIECSGAKTQRGGKEYYQVWTKTSGNPPMADYFQPGWAVSPNTGVSMYVYFISKVSSPIQGCKVSDDDMSELEGSRQYPGLVLDGTARAKELWTKYSDRGCLVNSEYIVNAPSAWKNKGKPGNFILRVPSQEFTLTKYTVRKR